MQHAVDIRENVVVPETDHTQAALGEEGGAFLVRFVAVLPTIGFDDKTRISAQEIDDVRAERCLTAELVAGELAVAEALLQEAFGVGRVAAQAARVGVGFPDQDEETLTPTLSRKDGRGGRGAALLPLSRSAGEGGAREAGG